MKLDRTVLERRTTAGVDIIDLTPEIEDLVAASDVDNGWLQVVAPGSTASITTIEFESGAVNDLKRALERIAPIDGEYDHNLRWGDGNGYSHVRAALMGPSLTMTIHRGRVEHGTWQQIVLCDFDNKPRQRRIVVQIAGN